MKMKSSVRIEKHNETEQRDRKYSSIATGNSNANEREEKSPGHEIPLTLCHYIKQWQRFTFTYVHILPFQTAHPLTNGNNAIKNHIPIWFSNVYSLFLFCSTTCDFERHVVRERERESDFFSHSFWNIAFYWLNLPSYDTIIITVCAHFSFFSLLMCFFFNFFLSLYFAFQCN